MTQLTQFGSVLKVKTVPREELPQNFDGCADEGGREIVVPDDLSPDAMTETIAHEYFEIANDRLSLELSHSQLAAVAVIAVEIGKQMGNNTSSTGQEPA